MTSLIGVGILHLPLLSSVDLNMSKNHAPYHSSFLCPYASASEEVKYRLFLARLYTATAKSNYFVFNAATFSTLYLVGLSTHCCAVSDEVAPLVPLSSPGSSTLNALN